MPNNQKIPEGWSVKKLGECVRFFGGYAYSSQDCTSTGIKWLKIGNVGKGKLEKSTFDYLPLKYKSSTKNYLLKKGDIVMALTRPITDNQLKIAYIDDDEYLLNQRVGKLLFSNNSFPNFIYTKLTTPEIVWYISSLLIGTDPPNLTGDVLNQINILLPPLPEQEKIAGILGTWDEAIEKLSNLIEQKKLLKKGLMQKLLTGKTLLPGFTQPWKEVAIQDFCNIKRGGSPRPIENYLTSSDDGLNWLKIGDISPDAKYIYKTESKIKKDGVSKTTLVHSDDFILSNSMSFGRPYIMKIDACIHDGWLALTSIKKDVSKEFLFYLLSFSETQKKFNICAAGSGVRNLNKDIVGEVKIQLPPYYEQQAIADVLSTADDEINLLNQKLEALKEQKKGLMQQLLTGQIRVKVN